MTGLINFICKPLTFIGALNWGMIGLFNFNLVQSLFGAGIVSQIIYILVGVAAVAWLIWGFVCKISMQ